MTMEEMRTICIEDDWTDVSWYVDDEMATRSATQNIVLLDRTVSDVSDIGLNAPCIFDPDGDRDEIRTMTITAYSDEGEIEELTLRFNFHGERV